MKSAIRAGCAALIFSMALTVGTTTTASAAEYDVWSCRGPDGSPISTYAWKSSEEQTVPGDVSFSDSCSVGGTLDAMINGVITPIGRSPVGRLSFRLPPGLVITGYELWRYLRVVPGTPGSVYRAGLTEQEVAGSESFGCASVLLLPYFGCTEEGDPSDPEHAANLFARTGLDLVGLSLWAECSTSGCLPAVVPPGALFKLYRSKVTVSDQVAPSPPQLSGSFFDPGDLRGKVNLLVESQDMGSGIRSFAISVDGGPEVLLPPRDPEGTCQEPFDRPQPCPLFAARLFELNTDHLSPGQHTVSGKVTDAAGNETPFGPITFRVGSVSGSGGTGSGGDGPGGGITPTNGSPAVLFPVIKLARTSVTHRPQGRVQLRGKILTASGEPVVGAVLNVQMEINRMRLPRRQQLRDVRSGPDGSFRIPVRGAGYRTVVVSFSPAAKVPPTSSARANVVSRLRPAIRRRPARLRRGQAFTLTGQLIGGGETAAGANVEIQSIVSGRWRTVANVTARRNGRFAWRYRFRYVDRDAIFSFRAVVRRTPGWPWPTLRSRKVTVRIDATR